MYFKNLPGGEEIVASEQLFEEKVGSQAMSDRLPWTCPMCHRVFNNAMSKATHYNNFYKSDDDMTRCDKTCGDSIRVHAAILTTLGVSSPSRSPIAADLGSPIADLGSDGYCSEGSTDTTAIVTTPVVATPLGALARRPPASKDKERRTRCISYTLGDAVVPAKMMPRNLS